MARQGVIVGLESDLKSMCWDGPGALEASSTEKDLATARGKTTLLGNADGTEGHKHLKHNRVTAHELPMCLAAGFWELSFMLHLGHT